MENIAHIKIRNSELSFVIDVEDFIRVSSVPWWISKKSPGRGSTIYTSIYGGKTVNLSVANFILQSNRKIDHVDRNIFNNRKSNFRFCSASQNNCNKSKTKKLCYSKYKGVTWNKSNKR